MPIEATDMLVLTYETQTKPYEWKIILEKRNIFFTTQRAQPYLVIIYIN